MRPVSYSVSLSGSGDNGDMKKVKAAFDKAVKTLRAADVTVNGALTGNVAPLRGNDGAGEIVEPAQIIHDLADNVE